MESLIAPSINLFILIAFMVYKLRSPMREFVSTRHQTIRSEIETVHDQLQQAQSKYEEFTAKLKAIDAELGALREHAKQDTLAMRQKVASESQRAVNNLILDSKNAASSLYSDLRGQLYADLSIKVLERGENLLKERLTGDDRVRIRKEFSQQLGSVQ